MSRAILDNDMIVKLTVRENIGTEVGDVPKDVALNHLRWDGTKLVNIGECDHFYVDEHLRLHVVELDNTKRIDMTFKDRKKLIIKDGEPYLDKKTVNERLEDDAYSHRRKGHYPSKGDQIGAILKYLETKKDLTPELKEIIEEVKSVKEQWPKSNIKS